MSSLIIIFQITNYFWYLLFRLGSQLGDETFYAFFFSFWFWNIDGAVGRRVILVWNLVMYIGQVLHSQHDYSYSTVLFRV